MKISWCMLFVEQVFYDSLIINFDLINKDEMHVVIIDRYIVGMQFQ